MRGAYRREISALGKRVETLLKEVDQDTEAYSPYRIHTENTLVEASTAQLPHTALSDAIHSSIHSSQLSVKPHQEASPKSTDGSILTEVKPPEVPTTERAHIVPPGSKESPPGTAEEEPGARDDKHHTTRSKPKPVHLPSALATESPSQLAKRTDPIVAFAGRLGSPDGFKQVQELAYRWLKIKQFDVPADPSTEFDISSGDGGRALTTHTDTVWALRAETPDGQVGQRRWRFELVLIQDDNNAPALGFVLYAIGPARLPSPAPSIPRLIGELVDRVGLQDLHDGFCLTTAASWVESEKDVSELVARLESPDRQQPVIVLSGYRKDDDIKTLLDPKRLAKNLRGLAQVVVLGTEQRPSWALTDHLGKKFSVYGAALRLYRPGFTTEDVPTQHPLWTPATLDAASLSLSELQHILLHECASCSVRILGDDQQIPSFDHVRSMVWQYRFKQLNSADNKHADKEDYPRISAELQKSAEEANQLQKLALDETEGKKGNYRKYCRNAGIWTHSSIICAIGSQCLKISVALPRRKSPSPSRPPGRISKTGPQII